jgi:Flp pilus assembly protein TadB
MDAANREHLQARTTVSWPGIPPLVATLERKNHNMWAASCAAGGCRPSLANVSTPVAVGFAVFLLVLAGLWWWAAHRQDARRRSRATYEFDDHGRARRVPPAEETDAIGVIDAGESVREARPRPRESPL